MNFSTIKKRTLDILFFALIGVLQISFIQALPYPLNTISLPIVYIILSIINNHYENALGIALVSGSMIGIMIFQRFGIDALAFFAVAVLANILFHNLFTNVSLYSILLMSIISLTLFHFLTGFLAYLYFELKLFSLKPLYIFSIKSFVIFLLINIAAMAVLRFAYRILSKKGNSFYDKPI